MLEKLKQEEFENVYAIMERSFPEDERRTKEEQRALLDNPLYHLYILRDEVSLDVKAFVAVWKLDMVVFVEHLAVNPQFRNGGLGSLILKELMQIYDEKICLEVEPPIEEMAKRRIGFYERNGFFLNSYDYMQPPISEGRRSIPLLIMTSGSEVTEEEFGKIRDLLYSRVYQITAL